MKTEKFLKAIMTLLIVCGLAATAWSGDDAVNFGNRKITEDDIMGVFADPAAPRSRAIIPVKAEKPRALSMEINFELNSSQLTPKSCEILDVMGRAINNDRLKAAQFIIEGHTDASGSESLNRSLSKNRAQAVKNYLIHKANISSDRLKTIGKGESELLFSNRPYAPENRRVKFIMGEN